MSRPYRSGDADRRSGWGIGRRHGEEGFFKYTESKTVATQRVDAFSEPPIPFGAFTRVMAGVLKIWRRIPGLR